MPTDDERSWQEVAASNRERIKALEHELDRTRDQVHKLGAGVTAVNYLAREMGKLETAVEDLSAQLRTVAARAVEKPSATALSVLAQYLALAVALVAVVLAVTR